MSLREKISISIANMGIQRVLDFINILVVTSMVVRSLSRQEYGMLSVVVSYGIFFNILNISISSILLRDYQIIKERINEYMHAFILFAIIKSIVLMVVSAGIGFFLYNKYHNTAMIYVLILNTVYTSLLFMTEPFATLLSVDFRQSILTKINLLLALANIFLSIGVLLIPSAIFVMIKNGIVATIGLLLTAGYARTLLKLQMPSSDKDCYRIILNSFLNFSIWSHFMGITTDIIYRADLLILGWLNAPFQVVGNYNISLQLSNFTKLLPQILQYNTSLGLSNSKNKQQQNEITLLFIKYSFLLSLITMGAYILLGPLAIQIIAGRDIGYIFHLGLYIISGLCIFNTFRPLISYGTVVHNINECFCYATLPSGIGVIISYTIMGTLWGAEGLAMANLLGGCIMTLFTLIYIHFKTDFRWKFTLLTNAEKNIVKKIYLKLNNHK